MTAPTRTVTLRAFVEEVKTTGMHDVVGRATLACGVMSMEDLNAMYSLCHGNAPVDVSLVVPIDETPMQKLQRVQDENAELVRRNAELQAENDRLKASLPSDP